MIGLVIGVQLVLALAFSIPCISHSSGAGVPGFFQLIDCLEYDFSKI